MADHAAPTQSRFPSRAVIRTMFQGAVGLAAIFPVIVVASGLDEQIPAVAGGVLISGMVTRIMAAPQVESWLKTYVPWLASEPKENDVDPEQ